MLPAQPGRFWRTSAVPVSARPKRRTPRWSWPRSGEVTLSEQWKSQLREIQKQAAKDGDLRRALQERPEETLRARGVALPENTAVQVRVVEAQDREAQFAAGGGAGAELSDDLLQNVAGGIIIIVIVR